MKRFAFLFFILFGFCLLLSAQTLQPAGWYAGDTHVHRSCGGLGRRRVSLSPRASVFASFSEALNATTVTTTNFQLLNSAGTAVTATVAYVSATNTATLTPTSPMSNSTTYTAVVKGGGVKDLAGNALAADYKWSFTTSASSALVISTQSLPEPPLFRTLQRWLPPEEHLPIPGQSPTGSLPTGLLLSTSGVISGTPTVAGTFSFSVKVTDSGSPVQTATQAVSISITAVGSTQYTIWPTTAVPSIADAGADSSVEVGLAFRSDNNGYITGIRFYKGTGNVGTHIANLWSSAGALLASATFTNETASGWQQVTFSSPVAITAGTTYTGTPRPWPRLFRPRPSSRMLMCVTLPTKSNQVFVFIEAAVGSKPQVMNFQILSRSAKLTLPAISVQNLPT